VNIWYGFFVDRLNRAFVTENRMTSVYYLNILQNCLPPLVQDIPLQTGLRMLFQHDGAWCYVGQQVTEYLSLHYSNYWIGGFGL
jgi:hypothetical protein